SLGPAAVVADRHAQNAAQRAPDLEAEIAGLEIALLQMLKGALGIVLGMAREMDLAVFPDNLAALVGQYAGVEMVSVGRQLGVAKVHRDPVLRGAIEQRARRRVWHFALEPGIDFRLVRHVPALKEPGERKLRID